MSEETKQPLFVYNLSGRTLEELQAKKIYIGEGDDKKEIVIPVMKTRQIVNTMKVLKKINWAELTYETAIEAAGEVLPHLIGLKQDDILDIELEDWEVLFAHFEAKNKYFLSILRKMGILQHLQAITESFGIEIQNTSEKSELDIKDFQEQAQKIED